MDYLKSDKAICKPDCARGCVRPESDGAEDGATARKRGRTERVPPAMIGHPWGVEKRLGV